MRDQIRKKLVAGTHILIALIPIIAASILLYFLTTNKVWDPAAVYRDGLTGVIVTIALLLAFAIYSRLAKITK